MPVFRGNDANILFIHVPKTGGSSIEAIFQASGYKIFYRDPKLGRHSMNWLRNCSPQHMHAAMLEQQFQIDRFDLVFMLVREPMSRFKSEYAMRNASDVRTDPSSVDQWSERALSAYAENNFLFDNHLRPQSEFYVPGCRVYHLESGMEEIIRDLNQHAAVAVDTEIPRVMDRKSASGVSSSDVCLSSRLQSRIRDLYSADFSRFGY